ncbi:MAG: class III extradiol dioxygenase subunit B-like domain-containing protein [Nocardioidaceae bacterium]
MLVAAAVCPHPPMLVPEIAQGAAAELDDLRDACDAVVAGLLDARPERVVVVASGGEERGWPGDARPDFAPYGVSAATDGRRSLRGSLGLSMGAWLLDRAGVVLPREYSQVTGRAAATGHTRTALLVMADGTAKRSTQAPGYLDERAEAFDADIAKALAAGDAEALERLDPAVGEELWVRGIPALHTLGATFRAQGGTVPAARLLYDAAPYGVGYFVALWRRSE